jgi:hypothetical protein
MGGWRRAGPHFHIGMMIAWKKTRLHAAAPASASVVRVPLPRPAARRLLHDPRNLDGGRLGWLCRALWAAVGDDGHGGYGRNVWTNQREASKVIATNPTPLALKPCRRASARH